MKKVEPNHKKKSVRGTRSAEAKSGAPRARGASGAHAAAGPGPCLGLGPHLLRRGSTCSRPRGGRRTPLRARGWGGEAAPCWARRRGEVTTGLTRLLGARRLTQLASPTQTSPSEEEPARDGEGGKKAEAAVCQLAFFGTSTECHCHQESRRRNAGRCPTACARRRVGEASEPQGLLHGLPGDLVELLPVVPPHLGSVHVSSAFIVGL